MGVPFKPLYERYEIKPDGCWQWTGSINNNGYGRFNVGGPKGRSFLAHRYFYEFFTSTRIPPLKCIDHLCRNKACVNWQHMEVVTPGVNTRRAMMKTECLRGHPMSGYNLRIKNNGARACRACDKIHSERARERRRMIGDRHD
jgi:hypothetical protein